MSLNRRVFLSYAAQLSAATVPVSRALRATIGSAPSEMRSQGPAPLRNRLTKTMCSGLVPGPNATPSITSGAPPVTVLYVVPIESPCYAVRLGFGNPFRQEMEISSATIWPSDSYGISQRVQSANGSIDTTGLGPTGGTREAVVSFNGGGADTSAVNGRRNVRSLRLPGDPTNEKNAARPFAIRWSDFVPCRSTSRADGGAQHLLFVYVTIASRSIAEESANFRAANLDLSALRGRHIYRFASWFGYDESDHPNSSGWKEWGNLFGPLVCIQYMSETPGIQVVLSGDSLSAAPTDDYYSTPLHRASWDISSPKLPIEVASFAWGGAPSSVYYPFLTLNAAAIRPSLVAYQPLSRNDGRSVAILDSLLSKAITLSGELSHRYGAKACFNISGCIPSFDGDSAAIAAFNASRNAQSLLAVSSGAPLIDGPLAVGDVSGGAPWRYVAGVSDDNTHINYAGAEAITPLARAALRSILGR